jgi:hypothetical protein
MIQKTQGTIHNGELMLIARTRSCCSMSPSTRHIPTPKISRLDTSDGLAEALRAGDVTVTFAHQ